MKRFSSLLPFFLLLLGVLHGSETWKLLTPTPSTAQIRDLAASPDLLVAVGEAGLVLTTADGETWEQQDSGTRETFEAVAYQGGVWLAYGSSGTIFSSEDTHTWSQRTGGLGSGCFAYGNGLHVATTRDPTLSIRVSRDGHHWSEHRLDPELTSATIDITFRDGLFWTTTKSSRLFFSADGIAWTEDTSPPYGSYYGPLLTGNGQLLLVVRRASWSQGSLFRRAEDGSWDHLPDQSSTLTGLGFASGKFFKTHSGSSLYQSDDAETWIPATTPLGISPALGSMTFALNQWWCVSTYGRLLRSPDATAWSMVGSNVSLYTSGIAPLGDDLLAGNGHYFQNGTEWKSDGVVPDDSVGSHFTRLSMANGHVFGVFAQSAYTSNAVVQIWSIDSSTTGRLVATLPGASYSDDIFYANGRYLTSTRRDGIWIPVVSLDGHTWVEGAVSNSALVITDLIGVADDKFWAVVGNGSGVGDLWTSTDGLNWTFALATRNNALPVSIATDGDTLLVGSTNGYYFRTAADGWSYTPGPNMASVHYDGTVYRAFARWLSWDDHAIITMADDQTWSTQLLYRFGSSPEYGRFATLGSKTFLQSANSVAVTTTSPALRLQRGLPLLTETVLDQPLVLTVVAESSTNLPLHYQWSAGGVDILGATTASLDLTVDTLENLPRTYGVKVSDGTNTVRAETQFSAYAAAAPSLYAPDNSDPITTYYAGESSGARVDFSVNPQGPGPFSYEWTRDGEVITGGTGSAITLHLSSADLGSTISVTVTSPYGSVSATTTIEGSPPVFFAPPSWLVTHRPNGETSLYLNVRAYNADWFQWRRNGVPIPGAHDNTFYRSILSPEEAGVYDVVAVNTWGTITSRSCYVTTHSARLSNLSVRAWAGTGDDILTPGMVIARLGNDMTPLVRAIGPTLSEYGVTDPLPNPALDIVTQAGELIGGNDQWGALPDYIARFNRLGAFPLPDDSLDAVSVVWNAPSPDGFSRFTVPVRSMTDEPGDALVEVYDDAPNDLNGDRLINLSARARVVSGHPLIAGFVVNGTGTVRLLIRAIGPTLASFDIAQPLSRPRLRLYSHDHEIVATNLGWTEHTDTESIRTTSALVGAFPLANDSADCVLLVDLPAGLYTAMIDGLEDSEGVALVELYEVP